MNSKNIAIVTGGYSGESVISYKSAAIVSANLDKNKYEAIIVNITEENWLAEYEGKNYPISRADFSFNYMGRKIVFEAVFIALHGTPGEDGRLQAYFDMIKMPYNTCNAIVAALTFNKAYCNRLLATYGVKTSNSVLLKKGKKINTKKILKEVGIPCFVKPNCGGSSLGMSKVNKKELLEEALEKAFAVGDEILVETFVTGTEITCGVVNYKGEIRHLGITEIVPANEFFDFDSKYQNSGTQEITPARISKKDYEKCAKLTEKIYSWLDCHGMIRVDYILQNNGNLHMIEINTVPGLSAQSIVPKQAAFAGISLQELFNNEVEATLKRKF